MEERKINIRKIIITLLLLLLLIIVLVMTIISNNDSLYTFPDYSKDGALEGVGIQSIIKDDSAYIAVHYPKVTSEQINKVIDEMIEIELSNFENRIQENASQEKPELYITFETYKYKSRLISFVFEIYENFASEDDGLVRIKTMTFDVVDEREIVLGELFTVENHLQILLEKAHENFSNIEIYKNNVEAVVNGLVLNNENFDKFILADEYIEFIFNPYQLSGKVGDVLKYKIPLNEIKEYINNSLLEEKETLEGEIAKEEVAVPNTVDIPQEDIEGLQNKKLIALTFDDGPEVTYTNQLLDVLKEEDVKATFFVLGSRAEHYPDTLRRIVAEGHQIGSHAYSHKRLSTLEEYEIQHEIEITNQIVKEITGMTVNALRPPYGESNETIKKYANIPIILWSVDPEDWNYRDADRICEEIVSTVKDGDIIILHDIYETTVQGTKKAIGTLKAEGYAFVTVETLIRAKQGEPVNNEVYRKTY